MRKGAGRALPGLREHRQHPDMLLLCKAANGPSPQLLMFVPFCASSVSEKGISCYSRSLLFSHGSYHMTSIASLNKSLLSHQFNTYIKYQLQLIVAVGSGFFG